MSLIKIFIDSGTQKKSNPRNLNEEEISAIGWQARMFARAENILKDRKTHVPTEHKKNEVELRETYANSPKSAMHDLMINYRVAINSSDSLAVAFEKQYVNNIVEQERESQNKPLLHKTLLSPHKGR